MSDRVEVEVTSSFNQSSVTNQSEVDGSTNCDQVDTSAYPFFMTIHSLVFLVSFKNSVTFLLQNVSAKFSVNDFLKK